MAYARTVRCGQCHNEYSEVTPPTWPYEHTCPACKQVQAASARKAHFDHLDTLSIEERIRRIEEWIYNYKPPVSTRDVYF